MPVTTIFDLKCRAEEIDALVNWKRTIQRCGATEVERDRATEELTALLRERALAWEEVRQAHSNRRKYNAGVLKLAGAFLGIGALVFILVV